MTFDHVLSVVPVTDHDAAVAFYTALFGRGPDNHPMPVLSEWRVTDSAWVQVFIDADRAGSTFLNFAVDDLAAEMSRLREAGLEPGDVEPVNKGVELSTITDPDGNVLRLIGNFRVEY